MNSKKINELLQNAVLFAFTSRDVSDAFLNKLRALIAKYRDMLLNNGWEVKQNEDFNVDVLDGLVPSQFLVKYGDEICYTWDFSRCPFTKRLIKDCPKSARYKYGPNQITLVDTDYAKSMARHTWWYIPGPRFYSSKQESYYAIERYKKAPRYWRAPGNELVFGHEFEIAFEFPGDRQIFATNIYNKFKPVICELDSSISQVLGLEVITPPWNLDNDLPKIKGLFNLMSDYNSLIPNDSYGWHITVNCLAVKNIMPLTAAGRLIYAINLPSLRKKWLELGRRDPASNPTRNFAQFEDDCKKELNIAAWASRHKESPVNHYFAAFLRKNLASVEIRFIKSTVDFNIFLDTMKTIQKLWAWADSKSPDAELNSIF